MFGIGGKLAMGMGVALLVMGGAFAWYFNSSQDEIATLTRNNATLAANVAQLKGTIEEQNQSIKRLEQTRQQDQEKILELSEQYNQARSEVSELRQTFSEHDLNMLSLRKPGLIERIINKGTAEEGREFIEMTTPPEELPEEDESTE
jgi:chromosome segregation ATPase